MRPHYQFLINQAIQDAKRFNLDRITVIEFGVASGGGLLDMSEIVRRTGFNVDIVGFDTFSGLPKPKDHRDCPWLWREGQFGFDEDSVLRMLSGCNPVPTLIKGNIKKTIKKWTPPSTIGAIAFDLDFFSSTNDAFNVFNLDHEMILPRVMCYFDDLHTIESVGVRASIREWNDVHFTKPIERSFSKEVNKLDVLWRWKFYEFHSFNHPRYNDHVCG